MKLLLLCLTTVFGAAGLFGSKKFDYLDFNSDKHDITWDDITDDLWP